MAKNMISNLFTTEYKYKTHKKFNDPVQISVTVYSSRLQIKNYFFS